MKQKIIKAFFVATFFTIGVVTGCSDAGNIKMGTEAETAKDADAAFERKANFFLNKIFSKIDKTEIDASKGDDV